MEEKQLGGWDKLNWRFLEISLALYLYSSS